jgi:hypothetical protein
MNYILRQSEKILDYFITLRKNDPAFVFAPRKINNDGRLDQGYWFLGNEGYLNLSFWNGVDWKERVHIIGFCINWKKEGYIELSAQGNSGVVPFLTELASRVPGLTKSANKNKWFKGLPGTDLVAHINYLLDEFKPIVDELLALRKPADVMPLDESYFIKYDQKLIDRRKAQISYGIKNKVTKLVWNTNGWKFPSGYKGKSKSEGNFEASSGYGHEEWLFDRSKPLNGYHYSFIQALNLETDRHVGKQLNISLYTSIANVQYYAGTIMNAEPITVEEGLWAYGEYQRKGWLNKMADDVAFVGADAEQFKSTPAEIFFNVKFKFAQVLQPEELLRISGNDPNITNNRFNLISQKGPLVFDETTVEEPGEDEGNAKSTRKVKRKMTYDGEYSPYHNQMQNEIHGVLKASKIYQHVYFEKGRVDLSAMKPDGEWHYFEIKTDDPKMSIRKALGQILEYAHFPAVHKAKKLIIIGDTRPDDRVVNYLNLLRETYELPVSYRCFDFAKKELSEDF